MIIDIQTEKPTYHQGDQVKGELVITADENGISGDSITLSLNEYWWHSNVQAAGTGWKGTTLDEAVLQQSFDFPPVTEHRLSFTLQLTRNCRITNLASDGKGYEKCGFEVELKGVKRKDHKHEFPLQVMPGREFIAIIETLIKSLQVEELDGYRYMMNNRQFYSVLASPDSRKSGFHALNFYLLQTNDGGVKGEIFISMDGSLANGWWERFRASITKISATETRPFQLTASQLFLSDGTANHSATAKVIEEVIESVIAPRRQSAF